MYSNFPVNPETWPPGPINLTCVTSAWVDSFSSFSFLLLSFLGLVCLANVCTVVLLMYLCPLHPELAFRTFLLLLLLPTYCVSILALLALNCLPQQVPLLQQTLRAPLLFLFWSRGTGFNALHFGLCFQSPRLAGLHEYGNATQREYRKMHTHTYTHTHTCGMALQAAKSNDHFPRMTSDERGWCKKSSHPKY